MSYGNPRDFEDLVLFDPRAMRFGVGELERAVNDLAWEQGISAAAAIEGISEGYELSLAAELALRERFEA